MNSLSNLRLGTRLLFSFALVAAISVVVGLIGLSGTSSVNGLMRDSYTNHTLSLGYLLNSTTQLAALQQRVIYTVVVSDANGRKDEIAKTDTAVRELQEWIAKERATEMSEAEKGMWKQFDELWPAYQRGIKRVMDLAEAGKVEDAKRILLTEVRPNYISMRTLFQKISEDNAKGADDLSKVGVATFEKSRLVSILAILIGFAVAMGLGVLVTRTIKQQVGGEPQDAVEAARCLAAGGSQRGHPDGPRRHRQHHGRDEPRDRNAPCPPGGHGRAGPGRVQGPAERAGGRQPAPG